MLKRALKLALVLTSCDLKRLTYANEYSIAISHKVVGVPVQLKAAEVKGVDVGEAAAAPYRPAASGSVDMGIKMKDNNGVWVPLGGGVEICLDSNGNIDSIKGTTRFTEWSATSWSAWDDGCTDVNYHMWYCQDNEVWLGVDCSSSCNDCTDYKARDLDYSRHYILASDGGYGCSYGSCYICSGNTLQHGHYEDGEWKERYEAPAHLHCRPNCEDPKWAAWRPASQYIDVYDRDDDAYAWADKYLLEENWEDDDDEDVWLLGHIKPNTPSAIVTSHTWTVFPLHSGIGKTGVIPMGGFGAKALTGCYIFTATGKNSANADILSKIVWKVDPVCTGLLCPKITGEFVGLDHEICIDKSGRIEKVTGPTSALLSDGAAPKATAAATLLAIAATAVVF